MHEGNEEFINNFSVLVSLNSKPVIHGGLDNVQMRVFIDLSNCSTVAKLYLVSKRASEITNSPLLFYSFFN